MTRRLEPCAAPTGMFYLHLCRVWILYDDEKRRKLEQDWTNLTFSPLPYPPTETSAVLDIRQGLPFDDGAFDAVFANHVLEHLSPAQASAFVREVGRVLRPGGVTRIVVPDLEEAARYYLAALERRLADHSSAAQRAYELAVINLLDQKVRDRSGGLMIEAMHAEADSGLLRELFGDVATRLVSRDPPGSGPLPSVVVRALRMGSRELAYALLRGGKRLLAHGDPRKLGENDRWGWDRVSLKTLLEAQGLVDYAVTGFAQSMIPGWERYDLDRSALGDYPVEPSVYVEARRPG